MKQEPRRYTQKQKRKILKLSMQIGFCKTVERFGLSPSTIPKWRKEMRLKEIKRLSPNLVLNEKYNDMTDEELIALLNFKLKMEKKIIEVMNEEKRK